MYASALRSTGRRRGGALMALVAQRVHPDVAKERASLLYSGCDKKGWTGQHFCFVGLDTSWSDLSTRSARAAYALDARAGSSGLRRPREG